MADWRDDLATWLAGPPKPHDPPGGATSCYTWLKTHGPDILAVTAAPRAKIIDPNRCAAGDGRRGRCTGVAVAEVRISMVGRADQWRKVCQRHLDNTASFRERRPLEPPK